MARGGGAARSMSEYLVSLGVEVDHRGLNRMRNALTMTKVTVMGVGAALALMTTAVVKASLSLTKAAESYEELAKSSKKATDEIASQEIALKVMGKTLDEINKNDKLKRTFEDIKKVGREIGFPTAGEGRRSLEGLLGEVDRLRATSLYAFQWINHHFLTKLAGPMDAFRKSLEEMRQNIVTNMPNLSARVGGFFAGFIQLIMAGVRGLGDLGKYIAALPDNIKMLLGAFSGLWVVMKANPIFMVLAGLTSLLLLLDDFQTYQAGGKSAWGDVWAGLEDGTFADKAVKGLEEGIDTIKGKVDEFLGVAEDVSGKFVDKIYEYDFAGAGDKAGKFLNNLVTSISGWFANPSSTNTLANVVTAVGGIATGIMESFGKAMAAIEWGKVGQDAGIFVNNLFTSISKALTTVVEGKDKKGGIFDAAWGAIKGLGGGIIDALGSFFETAQPKDIAASIGNFIKSLFTKIGDLLSSDDVADLGLNIGTLLGDAIVFAADLASNLVGQLVEALGDPSAIGQLLQAGSKLGTALVEGIMTALGLGPPGSQLAPTEAWVPAGTISGKGEDGKLLSELEVRQLKGEEKEAAISRLKQSEADTKWAETVNTTLNTMYKQGIELTGGMFGGEGGTAPVNPGWTAVERIFGSFETAMWDITNDALQVAIKNKDKPAYEQHMTKLSGIQVGFEQGLRGEDLQKFVNEFTLEPIEVPIDSAALTEEAKSAVEAGLGDEFKVQATVDADKMFSALRAKFASTTFTANVKANVKNNTGDKQTGVQKATGDRFDRPTHIEVAETGEIEYLIPIKRPERAKALILQMLSEMGSGARGILESFGIQGGGSMAGLQSNISGRLAMAGAYPVGGGTSIKNNSDNTYSSSPTINVYANDPYVAGLATAKEVDRAMLKYVRGVG